MKTALKAHSLAQLPHMAVKTCLRPLGATVMIDDSINDTQFMCGVVPSAGRFTIALSHGSVS